MYISTHVYQNINLCIVLLMFISQVPNLCNFTHIAIKEVSEQVIDTKDTNWTE